MPLLWAGDLVHLKQLELPPPKDVRHRTSDIRYRMLTCDIVRHIKYIRCRIRYEPTISYVMYIRCRTSISDIRHRIRYVDMINYDVVRDRYDVVRRHTTLYVTYDVVLLYPVYCTYYIARSIYNTMSYVARKMQHTAQVTGTMALAI